MMKKKNEKILQTHISLEQLRDLIQNLKCGLPCMEANFTINLGPFG